MAYLEPWVSFSPTVPADVAVLLRDAQTSGGLLLATAAPDALVAELTAVTLAAAVSGGEPGRAGRITVQSMAGARRRRDRGRRP